MGHLVVRHCLLHMEKSKIINLYVQQSLLSSETKEEQEQEISDLTRHVFESNSDCAQLNDEVLNLQSKLQSAEKSTSLLQVFHLYEVLLS